MCSESLPEVAGSAPRGQQALHERAAVHEHPGGKDLRPPWTSRCVCLFVTSRSAQLCCGPPTGQADRHIQLAPLLPLLALRWLAHVPSHSHLLPRVLHILHMGKHRQQYACFLGHLALGLTSSNGPPGIPQLRKQLVSRAVKPCACWEIKLFSTASRNKPRCCSISTMRNGRCQHTACTLCFPARRDGPAVTAVRQHCEPSLSQRGRTTKSVNKEFVISHL